MILYPDTEKEMTFSDYKPLPAGLIKLSVTCLQELYTNLENATENAWFNGNDLLALAIDTDLRTIANYLHFAEKREKK